jgi:hypothetical protein
MVVIGPDRDGKAARNHGERRIEEGERLVQIRPDSGSRCTIITRCRVQ